MKKNTLLILTMLLAAFNASAQYCGSSGNGGNGAFIGQVCITFPSCLTPFGVNGDYTNNTGMGSVHTVTPTGPNGFVVGIERSNAGDYTYAFYIDLNGDMDFDDAGENFASGSGNIPFATGGAASINANPTIPVTATNGVTRVRFIAKSGTAAVTGPCETGYNGETEDFLFTISGASSMCTDPTVPTVTATSPICPGTSTTLNISGTLNDATAWNVYSGSCGGTLVGTTTTGTFNVTPPAGTTTYFVRGEGGCVTPGFCGQVMVTSQDVTPPVITCPADLTVACDASTAPASTGSATATDTCDAAPGITFTDAVVAGVGNNSVITRTWTATDANMNVSSCDQVITVTDTTAPVITCPADLTVECDASTLPADTGMATATDNCDMAPVITFTDVVVAGVGNNSVITRTWTATDANMNGSSCDQVITVTDTTAPVITCPADLTVECDASTLPADTGMATATDNCDMAPVITFTDVVVAGVGNNSVITRTWTATDANMNGSSCDQVITVTDTTAPVITCPADLTVECDASTLPADTGMATATDNCDMAPVITFTDVVVAGVGSNSVITRTWTATDANMNASSCDQVITVTDTTAPVITCPADLTVECDASTLPADTGMATATDNCDMAPVITFTDVVVAGVGNNSVITRTWTATDANMNASSCDQVITVTDTTPPVITCPADLTVECDASTLPADTGMATATDNCDMAPVITFTDVVVAGVGSNSVITRTWTATDANMNASSCDQVITVTDTTAPVAMCAPAFTVQLDAMGMASITVADIENGSTDNCGMITTAIDVMDFTCADVGTPVTVTLTVTDENMNSSTCTTVVTVEDMIPPVITCPADVVVPTDPAALIIINPVSVTTTFPAQFGTDPVNTINGVGLTTFPSLDSDHAPTTPPNSFVGSGTTGSFTFDLGSSQTIDRLSFWNQNTGGPTNTVGLNSVQLLSSTDGMTFTPVTGGPTVFALVTTGVSLPETFTFPAVTATHLRIEVLSNHGNGNTGFAEIAFGYDAPDLCTASNVDLGTPVTSDNCPNFVVTNDAPMIFPLGDTTVTWTITDASGNAVMCTQLVTVEDLTPVTVVSGPIDIFTGTGPSDGDCATTVDYGVIDINSFVIEDNCGDATTTTVVQTGGLGTGSSFPVGITVEEFTLTDSNGNITIYTFEVTITDTTAPTLDCPGDLIVSDGGTGVYTIEDYTTTAADNCSSGADLVVTQDPVAGTEVAALSTTTVTVTATDAAGNVTECVFDILVDETLSVEDDVFNEASITVYPNPTNGELNIEAETTTIDKVEVYDLSGRLVKRVSFDSNAYQFDINDLESAVYLVQIYSGTNVVTKRVIKN